MRRKYLVAGILICLLVASFGCIEEEKESEAPETTTPAPTTPVPTTPIPTTTSPPTTTPAPTTAPPTTIAPTTEPPQEVLKYREVVNIGEGDPHEINPLLKEKELYAKDTIFFKISGDYCRIEWESNRIYLEIGNFNGITWPYIIVPEPPCYNCYSTAYCYRESYYNTYHSGRSCGVDILKGYGTYYLNYEVYGTGHWKIRILDYSTKDTVQPEYEWKTILYPERGKNFTLRKSLFRIKRVEGYKDNEKLPIDITISHTWIEQSEKKSEVVRGYSVELDAGEVSWCLYNDTSSKLYDYWLLIVGESYWWGYEYRYNEMYTDWTGYIEIQIPVFKE